MATPVDTGAMTLPVSEDILAVEDRALVDETGITGAVTEAALLMTVAVFADVVVADIVVVAAEVGLTVPAVDSKQLQALVRLEGWNSAKLLGTVTPADMTYLGQKDEASEAKRSRARRVLSS